MNAHHFVVILYNEQRATREKKGRQAGRQQRNKCNNKNVTCRIIQVILIIIYREFAERHHNVEAKKVASAARFVYLLNHGMGFDCS